MKIRIKLWNKTTLLLLLAIIILVFSVVETKAQSRDREMKALVRKINKVQRKHAKQFGGCIGIQSKIKQ